MKFDYTYLQFSRFLLFEPMILLTNTVLFVLCVVFYKRISRFHHPYAQQLSLFMLLLGVSGMFGAVAHAVHYQLGTEFFKGVLFLMNAFSLLSIYYCFRFSYTYQNLQRPTGKWLVYLVKAWVAVLLVLSLINGNFTLIKVHAGIVLLYCLWVQIMAIRAKRDKGSILIVYGICTSFLSILVHTLGLSLHKWFNQKDIAHVLMIVSLVLIYRGARKNLEGMTDSGDGRLAAAQTV